MVSNCHGECKRLSPSSGMHRSLGNVNFFRRWCKLCECYLEVQVLEKNRCPCCRSLVRMKARDGSSRRRMEEMMLVARY